MKKIFTHHAKKRMKKRNLGTAKVKSLLGGSGASYLGRQKYRASKVLGGRKVTVIYKKRRGKTIAITAWKE